MEKAVEKTVEWTKVYENAGNIADIMTKQINEFFGTEE